MSSTFLKGFREGQKLFAECISTLVNSILLTLVYFIGVGCTSIIAKIVGKKFLRLAPNPHAETYWETLELTKKPLEEHYRQF